MCVILFFLCVWCYSKLHLGVIKHLNYAQEPNNYLYYMLATQAT